MADEEKEAVGVASEQQRAKPMRSIGSVPAGGHGEGEQQRATPVHSTGPLHAEGHGELKQKPKKRPRKLGITSKAKKKCAVARAVIRKGKGIVRINRRSIELFEPRYVYDFITEPLRLAGGIAKEVNIDVNVSGGGFMGQAMGARAAVAKALVRYSRDDKLRLRMLAYDRMLLVDDVRRTEPKKPLGPKARRKKQKSKR